MRHDQPNRIYFTHFERLEKQPFFHKEGYLNGGKINDKKIASC